MINPNLTIITCIYNGNRFLPEYVRCIEKLKTVLRFQLIIVDDGSTDNTLEIVRNDLPYAKVLVQDNKGLPYSRNRGIYELETDFVVFLDVDDYLDENQLARNLQSMESDNNIDFLWSIPKFFGEVEKAFYYKVISFLKYLRITFFKNNILKENYLVTPGNVIFRTEFLRKHGLFYNPDLTIGEDWDFFIRCFQSGRSKFSRRQFLNYRIHNGSMTNSYDLTEARLDVLEHSILQSLSPADVKRFNKAWRLHRELSKISKSVINDTLINVCQAHLRLAYKYPLEINNYSGLLKNIIKKFYC